MRAIFDHPYAEALLRRLALSALLVLVACQTEAPDAQVSERGAGAVLPDTLTVDGVLVMHHAADAFERAPKWTLDPTPVVVYSGGDDPDFDLTYVIVPALLPDGRMVGTSRLGKPGLMLFGASGGPQRLLARAGGGPGELIRPSDPILLAGDTVVVIDGSTRLVNRFTTERGFIGSLSMPGSTDPSCNPPVGRLSDGRLVTALACLDIETHSERPSRSAMTVGVTTLTYDPFDTVASIPGIEMVDFETNYRGQRRQSRMPLRLGLRGVVAAWDSVIVSSGPSPVYGLDLRTPDGTVTGKVLVDVPRRAVTEEMRNRVIARELERLTGPATERMVDVEESRRHAREFPFADSLPPFGRLIPSTDGLLWVIDGRALSDTAWTATAFDSDGAIVARLTSLVQGLPTWFSRDQVLVREEDADGVVRFALYKVRGEK